MEPRQVRAPLQEPTGHLVLLIETEETTVVTTGTDGMIEDMTETGEMTEVMIGTGVMTGIAATTEIEETTEAMTETVEMAIAAMTGRIIVITAEMIVKMTGDLSGTAEMTAIRIGGMTEEVLKRRRVIGTGRRREALRKLPLRRA